MVDRSVVVRVVADTTAYTAGMTRASAATTAFARQTAAQTTAAASSVKNVGTQAGLLPAAFAAPTLAAGAALGFMAKAAIDWETAWTGVQKTVDGTPEQMAQLEGELRNLATTLPSTHTEIAAVAEAAGQLGVETANIDEFTKTMLDLGNTTNLSADEAATALARFMNIMGTSQTDVERLGSSIVELGNNYATTEREIVDMATRIASSGRQIGLTEGDVFGLATALSSVGIEAEAGGTAISRVLIEMGKAVDTGNDKLRVFAAVAGQSLGEFQQGFQEDAGAAVASFLEGLAAIQASGQSVQPFLEELGFSDVRVGNALRSAASAGDLFAAAMDTGNAAFSENIALAKEAELRYETTASKLKVAGNSVKDAAIDLGGSMTPLIEGAAEATSGVFGFLSEWNTMTEQMSSDAGIPDSIGDAWSSYEDAVWRVYNALGIYRSTADDVAESQGNVNEHLGHADKVATDAEGSTYDLEGAMDALGGTADDAADDIEAVVEAIEALGATYIDAERAQDDLTTAIRDASEPFRALAEAEQAVAEARRELSEASSDAAIESAREAVARAEQEEAAARAAISLEGNSEAAIENRERLRQLAEAAKEAAAAEFTLNKDTEAARAAISRGRDAVIDAAIALGYSEDQAEDYARQLGLIPSRVGTTIQVNGAEQAIAAAQRVRAALEAIGRPSYGGYFEPGYGDAPSPVRRASGGPVFGAGGPTDDRIPAMLSNGEYVLRAAAVARLGMPFLDALNSGRMHGFAQGGYVGRTGGETITRTETISIGQVVAHDYHDFRRQLDREKRLQALPGAVR